MQTRSLVGFVLLLAACAGRAWRVSTPKEISPLPTDAFYSFPALVVAGGIKPGTVQTIDARCADPGICEARVVTLQPKPGTTGAPGAVREVQVIAKRAGSTQLVVDAVNPIYNDHERHRLAVVVTAPPSRTAIALGARSPQGSDFLHRQGDADIARCAIATDYKSDVYGSERPDVQVYVCSPFAEIASQRRFRDCDDRICADDSYLLCTQARDGTIAATSMLVHGENGFEVKSVEGSFDNRACEPRK